MQEASVVEFRKHTKAYLDAVEHGDVVRIFRKGKPIADIVPIPNTKPAWKQKIKRLTIPGKSLSREVVGDREESY